MHLLFALVALISFVLSPTSGSPDVDVVATASNACAAGVTRLKLVVTANNGGGWVCVGRLRLFRDGTEVPFPANTTTTHTGIHSGYHSDNLYLPGNVDDEYCSDGGGFEGGRGREEVEITLSSAVEFDEFLLTRALPHSNNDPPNTPRDFELLGAGADGEWKELRNETGLQFGSKDVVRFDVRCSTPMVRQPLL